MLHRHIDNVNVKAVFSKCGKYRYSLTVKKQGLKNGKRVCVIMLNPSMANDKFADKSVQFVEKLIFEKALPEFRGVNELVVVNLYAFLQTKDFEGRKDQTGRMNNSHIEKAISGSDIILMAWGKSTKFAERGEQVKEMIAMHNGKQVYRTKKHPSRGFYNNFVEKTGISHEKNIFERKFYSSTKKIPN